MSTVSQIKELEKARAQVASLEQAIEADMNKELAALPAQYGFASAAAFVAAVEKASGKPRGRKPGMAKAAAKSEAPVKKKRRTRAVITDETRAQVKELLAAGKSGSEIANEVGISLPSVHNVKKGLVKKSGKAKAAVATAVASKPGKAAVAPAVAAKPKAATKPAAPAKKKPRKRAVITDETRDQVQKLVKAGKTGAEIAKEAGISLQSVNNIKKAQGLVKKA